MNIKQRRQDKIETKSYETHGLAPRTDWGTEALPRQTALEPQPGLQNSFLAKNPSFTRIMCKMALRRSRENELESVEAHRYCRVVQEQG